MSPPALLSDILSSPVGSTALCVTNLPSTVRPLPYQAINVRKTCGNGETWPLDPLAEEHVRKRSTLGPGAPAILPTGKTVSAPDARSSAPIDNRIFQNRSNLN